MGLSQFLPVRTPGYEQDMDRTTVPSITVQVVLRHPSQHPTCVYWVLNKEESDCDIPDFPTPKPRGWGNPGGGLEPHDTFDHSGKFRSFEDMILACAMREVRAETGFVHFRFEQDSTTCQFPFIYNMHKSGHRILTLAARLDTFEQKFTDNGEVEEANEIEGGMWFDFSMSPADFLRDEADLPYWSHVRRTIMVLNRLARNKERDVPPIHPLWKLIFHVGAGDPRFPSHGYCLEPPAWYEEMRYLINANAAQIDLDRIFRDNREQIEVQRAIEAERGRSLLPSSACASQPTAQDIYLLAEYRKKIAREEEEEEWREFMSAP